MLGRIPLEERMQRKLRKGRTLVIENEVLEGIDLSQRAILGVVFRGCDLANSNFSGSDLSFARFIDCNLYRADFSDSVLYTTWFYECNLTKASFRHAYLLGFRYRTVDITKAEFDDVPLVGLERKIHDCVTSTTITIPTLGRLPFAAPFLETRYSGIAMRGFPKSWGSSSKQTDPGPSFGRLRRPNTCVRCTRTMATNPGPRIIM